jgi:hypothetical protein
MSTIQQCPKDLFESIKIRVTDPQCPKAFLDSAKKYAKNEDLSLDEILYRFIINCDTLS